MQKRSQFDFPQSYLREFWFCLLFHRLALGKASRNLALRRGRNKMSHQILGLCLKTYRWKIFFKLEIRVSKNLALLGGGGGEPIRGGRMGGQEKNEVNHVTGEGESNIGSWDVLHLLWVKFEPSSLALKRIFWDLNGVDVVSECC